MNSNFIELNELDLVAIDGGLSTFGKFLVVGGVVIAIASLPATWPAWAYYGSAFIIGAAGGTQVV